MFTIWMLSNPSSHFQHFNLAHHVCKGWIYIMNHDIMRVIHFKIPQLILNYLKHLSKNCILVFTLIKFKTKLQLK